MTQVAASVAEHDQESSFPPRNQRREDSQIIAHYRRVSLESVQRLLIVFRASKLGGSVAGLIENSGQSSSRTKCPPLFLRGHTLLTSSNGYAAFMCNFMSNSSRRAVSQIATTAGCLSFLSAEMA